MPPMTNSLFSMLMANDMAPNEEISTIFVVGFPDDMQEREFQNMFLFSPGFEAATLKVPTEEDPSTNRKQIIGFAKFRTRLEALEARDLLCGRRVDVDKGCVLKAEMARKNLHTKRARLPLSSQQEQEQQHQRRSASAYEAFHSVVGPVPPLQSDENDMLFRFYTLPPSPSPSTSSTRQQQQQQQQQRLSINTSPPSIFASSSDLPSPPSVTSPTIHQSILGAFDTPMPCNTLYVGNLPFNTNKDELKAMFAQSIGFRRVSFKPKLNSGPMCFVEYDDVTCAAQALSDYNGAALSNSVKGGIRLSFSKNPLGVRQPSTATTVAVAAAAEAAGAQRESISWLFDTLQLA